MTPYPSGNASLENPSILSSSDGIVWNVPSGLTNPIDPYPGSPRHNADSELVIDSGVAYCFYIDSQTGSTEHIRVRTSSDGVSWSGESTVVTSNVVGLACPSVVHHDGDWMLWTIDYIANPSVIHLRVSSSSTSGYGSPATCVLPLPPGYDPWNIHVHHNGDRFVMTLQLEDIGLSDHGKGGGIWFATSVDGVNWTLASEPFLYADDAAAWDGERLYRACAIPDGDDVIVWYSARSHSGNWNTGRTVVPGSLVPS